MKKTFQLPQKQKFISGTLVHQTDKAYLFNYNGWDCWFPRSKCSLSSDKRTMTVPTWFRPKAVMKKQGGLI